jgi:hypothetical protein
MISKVEQMNMRQENYKRSQENKIMLENHQENDSENAHTMLSQLKETMNDHKDVNLPEILKVKQSINERIGDFDIDRVLDEEIQVNIMTEDT